MRKRRETHEPGMTLRSCLGSLTHPVWWTALIVLLLNDHLLKGSSAPSWLTGKLSDFAGMIVAPVLLAAIAKAQRWPQRIVCFALIVVPFCAIKLSTQAADATVAAVALFGIRWRVWSDWTDLMSLVVLPIAWRISLHQSPVVECKWRFRLDKFGAVLGGIACMATSVAAESFETAAYLLNLTHEDRNILIYRVTTPLDCAAVLPDPQSYLTPDRFTLESCKKAEPFTLVPLDLDWQETSKEPMHANDAGGPWRPCDAVLIRTAGAPDTIVFWNQLAKVLVRTTSYRVKTEDCDHAIFLEQFGNELVYGPGRPFKTWQVTWSEPAHYDNCMEAP